MPEIRLQDYVAEIKELIRSIRLDEAIAHSQHILRHYPKHIESYCLLGEACLEKEMYREAIEFFQRTLGADPENLIARVGLGVIYDEQGAFPEAIWQLERALELVPGNAEVRRELLRLYSQYDKIDKTRLRLTRGALGRLYNRNGLYERAISEFRAVLSQDPELPDIQSALVEALWREGRQVEVVELCLDLLDDLPNCLKANLILGDIWLRGGDEESARQCLSVARELDPENIFAQELMGRDSPLPLEEVLIPKLDLALGELGAAPAEAPTTEAVAVEDAAEGLWDADEELPEWLRDVGVTVEEPEEDLAADQEAVLEPAVDESLPTEEMPEWLQEVMGEEGAPAAREPVAVEGEPQEEDFAVEEEEPELLPQMESPWGAEEEQEPVGAEVLEEEIPEWLQELVGEAESVSGEEPVVEVEERIAGLPVIEIGGEAPEVDEEVYEPTTAEAEIAEVSAPPEVEEEELLGADEPVPVIEEAPDWLRELGSVEVEEVAEPPVAEIEEEIPEVEEEVPSDEELPDWLRDLGVTEVEEDALEPLIAEAEVAEVSVLPEAKDKDLLDVDEPAVAEPEIADASALPEAGEEELLEADEPVPMIDEIPDWLRAIDSVEVEEVAAPPIAEVQEETPEVEEEAPSGDEFPDWLRDLGVTEVEEVESVVEPSTAERETVGIPEQPIVEEELPVAEEEIPVIDQIPDWLRELEDAEGEEESLIPESLQALVAAGLLNEADIESAMAEMSEEDLAAQRAEAVPSWLSDLMVEEAVPEVAEPEPVFEEAAVEVVAPEPEPVFEEAAVEAVEPEPEPVFEEAALEVSEPEPAPVFEEAAVEVVEPEPEPVFEEAAVEVVAPEPEPVLEEAAVEVVEPEPEPVFEDAAVEVVAPEPEPVLEEAAVEVVAPEPEMVFEEAAVEVVEPEPEPVFEEAAVEVAEPEPEPVFEEAAVEVAEPEPEPVFEEAAVEVVEPEPEPVLEEATLEPEEIEELSRLDDLLNQLKRRPRDYGARLELARLHYAEHDWDRALASYEKLISARRFLPDVVDDLESLVGEEVEQSRIYHMLGDAYMQQEQLDKALEMYRLARQKLTGR